MFQLRSYRLGWQSQNIARFLLYQFCFIAEPVQVADDIGIDFFCTIFEPKLNKNNSDLIPRSSFAIQIKSEDDTSKLNLTRYLPYLKNLELPFFVGIVDRSGLTMTVFSGEYLIPLLVYKENILTHLEAELCDETRISNLTNSFGWLSETTPGDYRVLFPKVMVISANMDDTQLRLEVDKIQKIYDVVLSNIAAKNSNEFVLRARGPYSSLLFAGPESQKHCEYNLFARLTEIFFNLTWIYSNSSNESKLQLKQHFQLYENIYFQLATFYGEDNLPQLLRDTFVNTKNCIGSLHSQDEL